MTETNDQVENSTEQTPRGLEVRYEFTPNLPQILQELRSSLMVTTYQAGKLLVLGVHDNQLKITFTNYEQPMGLAIRPDAIAIGSRKQMNFLRANREVAPTVAPAGTWDVCYIPRSSTWTGSIHGHDLAWGREGLWIVNTLFSCLCTLHDDYSFVPRWQPKFITQLIDQDRCHLNGMALVDGTPRFVSAMAETDTAGGWRPTKATSGVIIDVPSRETIARGFAMPHSPRWHQGKLWVLDSGRGLLGIVEPSTGRFEVVERFPGYTRALSFLGNYAFVGLSRIRETSVFGGVPIAEFRDRLTCGIGVVDLTTGRTVATFQFLSGVTEIFAVEVAEGVGCPYVAGSSSDGKEHDVWIVPHPGMSPPVVSRTPWHYNESASTESGREILAQQVPPVVNVRQNLATGTSVTGQAAVSHAAGDPEEQVRRNPDDAVAWVNLGNRRQDQNRQEEALQCYERAVAANPSLPAARQNLGYILFNLGFPERARDAYRDLLVLNPAPMNRLLAASVLPIIYQSSEDLQRWRQSQQENLQKIVNDGVTVDAAGQLVPTTFFWAYQGQNDREIMRLRGKILRGHNAAAVHERTHSAVSDSTTGRPIRVGFLSAYFRNHTIGRLNLGRIEKLDRSKFHVTVCSASTASDDFSARFKKAADQYVLVPRDVRSAIRVISDLKLDLLIWTDVGMDALCSTLAFSRMAPVQCATWGHPDTTGSESIDYFLSSETLDDETARDHYTETLIRMPLSGTWYERPAIPAGAEELPARLSLPAGKHYYTCPQTLFKFHPDDDAVLRGILEADPEGVVILIDGRLREWTRRLRARWDKTLADLQSRIHFVPALEHDDYLRLLRISHVILDPLHFGGGNSSYEAIAMGTPIVTRPGMFLRSRITASLYRRMQFSECIVRTVDEFVKLAVQIGSDPAYRDRLRNEIDSRSSILFEQPEEIRCLEDTLIQCASRKC